MPNTWIRVPLFMVIALGLIGCSSSSEYSEPTACSVATEDMSTLLDTTRFTADGLTFGELPKRPPMAPDTLYCGATAGNDRVLITVDIVGAGEAQRQKAVIEEFDTFGVGKGTAAVGGNGAMWACGSVVASVRADELDAAPDAMQAAITSLAGAVGCYETNL